MTYPFRILHNLRTESLINDEWRKTGQIRSDQLYEFMGFRNKLPDEGFPRTKLVNVIVWCVPKIPGKAQDGARVWCECPDCGKHLTFGKLQQHRKVHR